MKTTALFLGLSTLLASMLPAWADATYLDRFDGRFRGSGSVQRDVDANPRQVSCRVSGTKASERSLSISGTCRAAVIVTRKIGAEIAYDEGSQTFSGVYTGSQSGPARLSGGRLRGDTLTMTLTYGRVVHGDRVATMTIANAGGGTFTLTVTDQIDGRAVQTSRISFSAS